MSLSAQQMSFHIFKIQLLMRFTCHLGSFFPLKHKYGGYLEESLRNQNPHVHQILRNKQLSSIRYSALVWQYLKLLQLYLNYINELDPGL